MLSNTQDRLRQWGAWVRGDGGLGYSSSSLAMMRARTGGGLPIALISDDDALAIDRVVAQVKLFRYDQYQCLKRAYVNQQGSRAIGLALRISSQAVDKRIAAAEAWIDVQLGE